MHSGVSDYRRSRATRRHVLLHGDAGRPQGFDAHRAHRAVDELPIASSRDRCRSRRLRSASCRTICTRYGSCRRTMPTSPRDGVGSRALSLAVCPLQRAQRQQARQARERHLAEAVLGARDPRRERSGTARGIHPLQPGQARSGSTRRRLAVFQFSSVRPERSPGRRIGAAWSRMRTSPKAMESDGRKVGKRPRALEDEQPTVNVDVCPPYDAR